MTRTVNKGTNAADIGSLISVHHRPNSDIALKIDELAQGKLNEAHISAHHLPSGLMEQCDWGGLLYQSKELYSFTATLEGIFTESFYARTFLTPLLSAGVSTERKLS